MKKRECKNELRHSYNASAKKPRACKCRRQATEQPPLKSKDGVLVFAGKAAGDIAGWVRRVREPRSQT